MQILLAQGDARCPVWSACKVASEAASRRWCEEGDVSSVRQEGALPEDVQVGGAMSKRHRRKKAPRQPCEPFDTVNERGTLVGACHGEYRNRLPDAPLGSHEPERIHVTIGGRGAVSRVRVR
jgi:hypothetical protein